MKLQIFNHYFPSSLLKKVGNSDDYRSWSIDPQGQFSVKSLSTHLKSASPMDKRLFSAIWKSGSPRRINILIWIMVFGSLNNSEILQKKAPNKSLSSSICPLCLKASENLSRIFLNGFVSSFCWVKIFSLFNLAQVFDHSLNVSVAQLLSRPNLPKKSSVIWENLSKAILLELWFERDQCIFHDKARPRAKIMRFTDLNATAWCSLKKEFVNYSIQDIYLNWAALFSEPA